MASYTENYALTKPTMAESADIRVINSNMDTVDDVMHSTQVSLAPAYDMTETYNTGDVVMYELLMYECLEDEVTGTWDATKWQRTTAGEHGGGSDVEVTQIQTEGKAVASIAVDGVSTDILVPELKVYGEASGDLITIEDAMEAPLAECKVTLEPQQAGTGDPSPDNVRPISGWDECKVNVSGVNIWDEEWELGFLNASNGQKASSNNNIRSKNYIPIKGGTSYLFYNGTTVKSTVCFYAQDKTFISSLANLNPNTVITTPANAKYMLFGMLSAYGTTYNNDISINYPSTDTEYHAYNGTTYTIQLGSTCYGGELDVTSGVLRVDRKNLDLGTLTYSKSSTIPNGFVATAGMPSDFPVAPSTSAVPDWLSSQYKVYSNIGIEESGVDSAIAWRVSGGAKGVIIRDSSYSQYYIDNNMSAFKTAMSGVQLVYELATPLEIQLTPTEVTLLRGINNLWSDGEMYVKYRRDIEMLLQRIADSLGGSNA